MKQYRKIKLLAKYIPAVKSDFRQFSRPLRGIGSILSFWHAFY